MDLGEKIRMYRMNAGLTQTKLGEMIEVSPRTISKWESGAAVPGLPEIRKICKALNIKKSDLIEEEEEEKPKKEVSKHKGAIAKNKQSYLIGIAQATSVISKILRVFLWIGIVCTVLCVLCIPALLNSFDVNNRVITVKGMDEKIELLPDGDRSYKIKIGDKVEKLDLDINTKDVDYLLDNYSKTRVVCYLEIAFIIGLSTMILSVVLLKDIEKIAENICNGDVFVEENPSLLRDVGYLMIALIVIPFLAGIVPNAVMNTNFGNDFSLFSVLEILFVFALSYIFEYGYKLSKNNSLPIYDEK